MGLKPRRRVDTGKQADLILLCRDKINVMPVNDPSVRLSRGWIHRTSTPLTSGGARKQAGQLVGADLARIPEQAITSRAYLASKVAKGLGGERCR